MTKGKRKVAGMKAHWGPNDPQHLNEAEREQWQKDNAKPDPNFGFADGQEVSKQDDESHTQRPEEYPNYRQPPRKLAVTIGAIVCVLVIVALVVRSQGEEAEARRKPVT